MCKWLKFFTIACSFTYKNTIILFLTSFACYFASVFSVNTLFWVSWVKHWLDSHARWHTNLQIYFILWFGLFMLNKHRSALPMLSIGRLWVMWVRVTVRGGHGGVWGDVKGLRGFRIPFRPFILKKERRSFESWRPKWSVWGDFGAKSNLSTYQSSV